MKNILLATDLAAETDRAFERAIQLASTSAAKLHILHVCPLYAFNNKKQNISLKKETKDTIKKISVQQGGQKSKTFHYRH